MDKLYFYYCYLVLSANFIEIYPQSYSEVNHYPYHYYQTQFDDYPYYQTQLDNYNSIGMIKSSLMKSQPNYGLF